MILLLSGVFFYYINKLFIKRLTRSKALKEPLRVYSNSATQLINLIPLLLLDLCTDWCLRQPPNSSVVSRFHWSLSGNQRK